MLPSSPVNNNKFPGYLSPSAGLKFADVPNPVHVVTCLLDRQDWDNWLLVGLTEVGITPGQAIPSPEGAPFFTFLDTASLRVRQSPTPVAKEGGAVGSSGSCPPQPCHWSTPLLLTIVRGMIIWFLVRWVHSWRSVKPQRLLITVMRKVHIDSVPLSPS